VGDHDLSLLYDLTHVCSPQKTDVRLQLQTLYDLLKESLTSHSRLTRLGVLRLLSCPFVSNSAESSAASNTINRCLQAEEISVDVQGVRERVLRISRLNHHLKDGDFFSTEIVIRWLIGKPSFIASTG
jgi:U3 small nucleolar RNA-associated protein 20